MDLNFISAMPASGFMPGDGRAPLAPGQVLPARLLAAEENLGAGPLLQLAGRTYTAKGDLPAKSNFFWIRVEEVASDQIRVKLLPTALKPDLETNALLVALGLKENKEHKAVVKQLLRWHLPLSRELVHDFIRAAQDLPPAERPAFWASRAFLSTLVFRENRGETEATPTKLLNHAAGGQKEEYPLTERETASKELLPQFKPLPGDKQIGPKLLTRMLGPRAAENIARELSLGKKPGPELALKPGPGKISAGSKAPAGPPKGTGNRPALRDNPKKMAAAVKYLLRQAGASADGQEIINRSRPLEPGQEAVFILSFIRGKDEGEVFIIHPEAGSDANKSLDSPRSLLIRLFTAAWGQIWIQLAFQNRKIRAGVWAEDNSFLQLARAAEPRLKDRINAAGWELVKLTAREEKISSIADLLEPPGPETYQSLNTFV